MKLTRRQKTWINRFADGLGIPANERESFIAAFSETQLQKIEQLGEDKAALRKIRAKIAKFRKQPRA